VKAKLVIESELIPSHTQKMLDDLGVFVHRVPDMWRYAARVIDSRGKTVWSDNGTSDIQQLLREGFPIVTAVRILEELGHVVETWRSVVDRAAKEDW